MKTFNHKKARRWLKVAQVVFTLLIMLFIILAALYGGNSSLAGGSGAGSTDFPSLVQAMQSGVSTLIGLLGVVMTIAGGVVYATSQGNPNQTKLGQEIIISAISGLALYGFSSWLLGGSGISMFFPAINQ